MASPLEILEQTKLPFPGSTGRGVRVAVIDSGINARHPHICGLAGGVVIQENGEVAEGDSSDYLGHGTAVAAAIQEKAPDADYFAIRLFRSSLRTSSEGLFNAIDWAVSEGMDVINLSLGTRNSIHAIRFAAAIARALEQGVVIVAARQAGEDICYPGSLPGAISVGLDWECPREGFRYESGTPEGIFYASGYPRSLPGMSRERNLNGISFAVANMSGFVTRACEATRRRGQDRCDAIRAALIAEALTSRES